MINKLNKTEQEKKNLWDSGMYSQIIYFKNGRNKPCTLAITTSKEQHDMVLESCKLMKYDNEVFYLYS
jgi:hypothetical protein